MMSKRESDLQPGFNTLVEFERILDRFEAAWRLVGVAARVVGATGR